MKEFLVRTVRYKKVNGKRRRVGGFAKVFARSRKEAVLKHAMGKGRSKRPF